MAKSDDLAYQDELPIFTERHYTPTEVAEILNMTRETVVRLFRKEPGVIEWGSDETLYKRKYKTIRIPRSTLQHFHETHRVLKPEPSKFQSSSQMRKKTTT